jgi:glycosyltransferase involved in cell wall biosynthesis
MGSGRLRVLHAIHDFLPRHRAGSEIYASELCKALAARHHVTLLCAEYDPSRRNGHLTWRMHEGIPVVELVNNWACASFSDTYQSPLVGSQIANVLRMVQPDVVHLHSLLNLSFELPALARASGIPVVATLHDYTLVCPSGGQRLHREEAHVCRTIDSVRCARCFQSSAFQNRMSFSALSSAVGRPSPLHTLARALNHRIPHLMAAAGRAARAGAAVVTQDDIDARLNAARRVFDDVDLFIAPSVSIAEEFREFGLSESKVRVSDYGFAPLERVPRERRGVEKPQPIRFGFVGTLVWHKGVHVLVDAVRSLPRDRYELTVFGDPSVFPDYGAELRRKSAGLPIRFAGPFDRDRTAAIYHNIDVLVVPSLWLENSPLVIHEAFMAGVPVVGARIGGISGLISHEHNGLLYEPPESSDALGRALRRLIDDPCQVAAFAGRLPAVKPIDEDAREWERIYHEVVERRASHRNSA